MIQNQKKENSQLIIEPLNILFLSQLEKVVLILLLLNQDMLSW